MQQPGQLASPDSSVCKASDNCCGGCSTAEAYLEADAMPGIALPEPANESQCGPRLPARLVRRCRA